MTKSINEVSIVQETRTAAAAEQAQETMTNRSQQNDALINCKWQVQGNCLSVVTALF